MFVLRCLLIVLIQIFMVTSLDAATRRYVSLSGNDSNNGTSWATAWRTITKVNSSTQSRDTVYFGSGIWRGLTLIPISGNSTSNTIYACSSWASPGETPVTNHPAKIYASTQITGWSNFSGEIYTSATSGITATDMIFNGEYILLNNSSSSLARGEFWRDGSSIRVRLRDGSNPANSSVEKNNTSSGSQSGSGSYTNSSSAALHSVRLIDVDYVTFLGLEFKYGNHRGITADDGCDNITVSHCKIGPSAGMGNINPGNIYTGTDNTFHNDWRVVACSLGSCYAMSGSSITREWGSAITLYSADGMIVESCVFYGFQTLAGIYHKNDNPYENYGNTFRYNLFTVDDEAPSWNNSVHFGKPLIMLWREQNDEWIYGNIFKDHPNGKGIALMPGSGTDNDFYVYNNTFINVGMPFTTLWSNSLGSTRKRNCQFKYNVIYGNTRDNCNLTDDDLGNPSFPTIIDSNLYYVDNADTFSVGGLADQNYVKYSWTQWRAQGFDKNSDTTLNASNQDFNNLAGGDYSRQPKAADMDRTYGGARWRRFGAIQSGVLGSCTPSGIVSLSSPVNGALNLLLPVVLDWTDYGAATGYRVQVDTDPAFASPDVDQNVSGSISTYTVVSLPSISTYYWRVSTQDSCGWGSWTTSRNFTLTCSLPATASLTSPANGATGLAQPVVFDWSDVAGATNYQIQVDDSSDFSSPLIDQQSVTSTYSGSSMNASTTYNWRVRAQNSCGWGSWTSARTFSTACSTPVTPTLVSPANAATGVAAPVALDWADVATATNYQVQVDNNSDFSSVTLDQQVAVSTYAASGLAEGTVYYWRVRAQNACGWGSWSATRSFTTACTLPVAPTLATPADGATNLVQPIVLDWNDVATATNYQVQVDNNSNFASTTIDQQSATSTFSASGLTDATTFYWRVRAQSSCGWGSWSTSRSFTTGCTLPGVATLNTPANGALNVVQPVALDWSDVSGATLYQVQVDNNSDFSSTAVDQQPATSTYSASGLTASTLYYWRVRAQNSCGWGSWSASRTFTPVAVDINAPTIGSVTATNVTHNSALISWTTNEPATSLIDYGTSTSYGTSTTEDPTLVTQHEQLLSGLDSLTTYHFQVRSQDAAGNEGLSGDMEFTTLNDVAAGLAPRVSSTYPGYDSTRITDGELDPFGAEASTWAAESATQSHWVEINFGTNREIDRVAVYWAWNELRQAWMTSQQFRLQVWNGTAFVDVTTVNNALVDSCTFVDITPVTTSRMRYFQPTNGGPTTYPAVVWLSELELLSGVSVDTNSAPTAPGPSAPANGATVTTLTPTLTVTNSTDADGDPITYEFQVSTSAGFGTITSQVTGVTQGGGGTTSWVVSTNLTSGVTYYWRARAYDGTVYSSYSTSRSFSVLVNSAPTIPALSSPAAGAQVSRTPSLVVTNSTDAEGNTITYEFQVATSSAFTTIVAQVTGIAQGTGTTSWTVTPILNSGTTYYWRARAYDGALYSGYAAYRSMAVAPNTAPGAPLPQSPTNGSRVIDFTPDLVVGNATDANGDVLTYQFYLYNANTTTLLAQSPMTTQGAGTTSWTSTYTLVAKTGYTWRSRSYDGQTWSSYSATRSFRSNRRPPTPVPVSPIDGDTIFGSVHQFVVQNSSDPDGDSLTYDFQVYSDSLLTVLVESISGIAQGASQTSAITSTDLAPDQYYWWIARATDSTHSSDWCAPEMFYQKLLVLDVEDAPNVVAPLSGSTVEFVQPLFVISWSGASDTSLTCLFELSKSNSFEDIYAAGTAKAAGNQASWTPDIILTEGVYYWRAKRGSSDYSQTVSFSVVAPVYVSPNPFAYAEGGVIVHNLPVGSRFEVYTSSGDQVREISNLAGDYTWDVRNSVGEKLGSGVFLWYVHVDDKTISGKLIVRR